ncbi:MaoC family dehydratase [Chloroflexota bacterium]
MEREPSILDKLGITIGWKNTHVKTVTVKDIDMFAEVSGDYNPVHVDDEYAKKTFFHGRIAHGVFALALLSAAGEKIPGMPILLSATSKYSKPVYPGDTITAVTEIVGMRKKLNIVTMKAACTNQKGETVVEGEFMVRMFEAPPV